MTMLPDIQGYGDPGLLITAVIILTQAAMGRAECAPPRRTVCLASSAYDPIIRTCGEMWYAGRRRQAWRRGPIGLRPRNVCTVTPRTYPRRILSSL